MKIISVLDIGLLSRKIREVCVQKNTKMYGLDFFGLKFIFNPIDFPYTKFCNFPELENVIIESQKKSIFFLKKVLSRGSINFVSNGM